MFISRRARPALVVAILAAAFLLVGCGGAPTTGWSSPTVANQTVYFGAVTGKVFAVGAALAGIVLFAAASFQQVGLVHTTAANAGFITCLYVILVPIVGALLGRATGARIWIGALLALAGLYVLSIGDGLTMAWGDLLVLAGAFFWTGHIPLINRLVARMEALELALGQFVTCAALSLVAAVLVEPRPFAGVVPAAVPILYGGLLSIGVAYTLQVVAQKTAHPAHASIIMSMEALFAGVGGVLILGEPLHWIQLVGAALPLSLRLAEVGFRAVARPGREGDNYADDRWRSSELRWSFRIGRVAGTELRVHYRPFRSGDPSRRRGSHHHHFRSQGL